MGCAHDWHQALLKISIVVICHRLSACVLRRGGHYELRTGSVPGGWLTLSTLRTSPLLGGGSSDQWGWFVESDNVSDAVLSP